MKTTYHAPRSSPHVQLIAQHQLETELVDFYKSIESHIPWSDTPPTFQSGLHCSENHPDDLLLSCGAGRDLKIPENEFKYLANLYEKTVIEKLLNSIPRKICRLRWMRLQHKSCYSMHQDPTPRVHIPIITNENSFFVFAEGGIVHLEPGGIYLVDTTQFHTFMNGGLQDRTHLVAALV